MRERGSNPGPLGPVSNAFPLRHTGSIDGWNAEGITYSTRWTIITLGAGSDSGKVNGHVCGETDQTRPEPDNEMTVPASKLIDSFSNDDYSSRDNRKMIFKAVHRHY